MEVLPVSSQRIITETIPAGNLCKQAAAILAAAAIEAVLS
jgi:hypothetical protein